MSIEGHSLPIQINQMSLRLKQRLCLNNICLSLDRPIVAIAGPNGSGKTLFLKALCGLLQPSSGTIIWPAKLEPPDISWLPHRAVVLHQTIEKNIALTLKQAKPNKSRLALAQAVNDALSWAGIDHLALRYAPSLSAGEQQLLALARAWSLQPKVLILDEPIANLDPDRQVAVSALIRNMANAGCRIIFSSHNTEQVNTLADQVVYLQEGEVSEVVYQDAHQV